MLPHRKLRAESPLEPVIARRLGLNKVHDLSATEARVHTIGVPPSVGSDGALTGHGCARSAEIVGRIVLRGHPLHAANACVKY